MTLRIRSHRLCRNEIWLHARPGEGRKEIRAVAIAKIRDHASHRSRWQFSTESAGSACDPECPEAWQESNPTARKLLGETLTGPVPPFPQTTSGRDARRDLPPR